MMDLKTTLSKMNVSQKDKYGIYSLIQELGLYT